MFLSRFVKGVLFSNGRYMKGVSFLPKMVYKRVRDRTSGRSLPVLIFFQKECMSSLALLSHRNFAVVESQFLLEHYTQIAKTFTK